MVILFFFLTIKYYLSDEYKKKSFRKINNYQNVISQYSLKLNLLENDTENIIYYIEDESKNKKKYNFWKLLESNE